MTATILFRFHEPVV